MKPETKSQRRRKMEKIMPTRREFREAHKKLIEMGWNEEFSMMSDNSSNGRFGTLYSYDTKTKICPSCGGKDIQGLNICLNSSYETEWECCECDYSWSSNVEFWLNYLTINQLPIKKEDGDVFLIGDTGETHPQSGC